MNWIALLDSTAEYLLPLKATSCVLIIEGKMKSKTTHTIISSFQSSFLQLLASLICYVVILEKQVVSS